MRLDTIFLAAPTSTDARLATDRRMLQRLPVPDFAHGRHRDARSAARGIAGAGAARAPVHPAADRRWLRNFAAGARYRALAGIADAAVVGSALVAEIEKAAKANLARGCRCLSGGRTIRAAESGHAPPLNQAAAE